MKSIFLGQNHETQLQQRYISDTPTTRCDEQGSYMFIDISLAQQMVNLLEK